MNKPNKIQRSAVLLAIALTPIAPALAEETLPDSKILMGALVSELTRSMDLQMEDLQKPYFIQYYVDDTLTYQITSSYGDLTSSDRDRSRTFHSRVRVGSYELDNTNFSGDGGFGMFFGGDGGGGGRARLPLDDDDTAIRQAIWWATDQDYKDSVETLTKKRAHLKDKTLEDRPNDFSKASVVELIEPTAKLDFDQTAWEARINQISAAFKKYKQVQDSRALLLVGAGNSYIVNSEGTRLRWPDVIAMLIITADLQAEDGMKMSDSLTYAAATPQELPSADQVVAEIDEMVANLTKLSQAPILDRYTGPVLFDGLGSAQIFRSMMSEAVAGEVDPVGTQRRQVTGGGSLEKKIGQRILPKSIQVYDDPSVTHAGGKLLLGHFKFDDEGVRPERVNLVTDGVLKSMVMSRVPTKKLSGSNGHARLKPGGNGLSAAVGCLFIESDEGVSNDELKAKLIEAARDEGLEFGLRIAGLRSAGIGSSQMDLMSMFMAMQQRGGEPSLGDPVYAYKVYVEDGREELVRGLEFGQVKLRDLKDTLAAGKTPAVYNYIGVGFAGATPPTSIVAPALLFEELELSKIEQEQDKLPILKTPLGR